MTESKLTTEQINTIATTVKARFREDVPENETDPDSPDFPLLYFPETGKASFDRTRYQSAIPPVVLANFSKNQIITMSEEEIAFHIRDSFQP